VLAAAGTLQRRTGPSSRRTRCKAKVYLSKPKATQAKSKTTGPGSRCGRSFRQKMRLPAAATVRSGPRFQKLGKHGRWCDPGCDVAGVVFLWSLRRGGTGGGLSRRVDTGWFCIRLLTRRATAAPPQHRSSPGSPPGFSKWHWYLCGRPGALSGVSHVVAGRGRAPAGSTTPLHIQCETGRGVFQPTWPQSEGGGVKGTPRKQGAKVHQEGHPRWSSFLEPCCCSSKAAVLLDDAACR